MDADRRDSAYSRTRRRLHEITWTQYVGPSPRVIQEVKPDSAEARSIIRSSQSLRNKFSSLSKIKRQERFAVPHDGLCAIAIRHTLLLTTADRSTLIGGIEYGLTFIEEAHRGQGYSKYLHLAVDGLWHYFLGPSHYSAGGLAARASAHRTATELAVEAGLQNIHPENLKRYGFEHPIQATAPAEDDLANGSFKP